jgi:hypothetical protein
MPKADATGLAPEKSADHHPPAHDSFVREGLVCNNKSISLVKSLSGGLGPKREDRPAAFAGRSESVFWIFCWWDTARAYTGEYPIPTRAPSTPQADHTGKESENAAGEKADTFRGKQCDPLQ